MRIKANYGFYLFSVCDFDHIIRQVVSYLGRVAKLRARDHLHELAEVVVPTKRCEIHAPPLRACYRP